MSAAGLALGWLGDHIFGDPRRGHPVAAFGSLAGTVESLDYRDSRAAGVLHVALLVGVSAGLGLAAERVCGPRTRLATTALATWAVLGGRSLRGEAAAMATLLEDGDLAGARIRIRSLVGRDPSVLDASELCRAAVESVAENTSDAVVAPLLWGGVFGVPGLLGYRAVNTLDAMIGHHTPRLERFGWFAARLDDVVNWFPARAAALLAVASAPLLGGRASRAVRIIRRDAAQHPSPNAGPVEAAFAGALDLRLGGRNVYAGRTEDRGVLGDGAPPQPRDIAQANRLSWLVGMEALAVAVLLRRVLVRSTTGCRLGWTLRSR